MLRVVEYFRYHQNKSQSEKYWNTINNNRNLTVGPSTGYWKLLIKFDASRSGLGDGARVVGGARVGVGSRVPN